MQTHLSSHPQSHVNSTQELSACIIYNINIHVRSFPTNTSLYLRLQNCVWFIHTHTHTQKPYPKVPSIGAIE